MMTSGLLRTQRAAIFSIGMLLSLLACQAFAAAEGGIDQIVFTCSTCHGEQAEGRYPLHIPALAGQNAAYLIRQLRDYRDGKRGASVEDAYGQQMALMAAALSDEEIVQLAARFSGLAPSKVSKDYCAPDSEQQAVGKAVYQSCIACHGSQAEGNTALDSPRLDILHPQYIAEQLVNYQEGLRGGTPTAQGMAAAVRELSGLEITAVSAFICSLPE